MGPATLEYKWELHIDCDNTHVEFICIMNFIFHWVTFGIVQLVVLVIIQKIYMVLELQFVFTPKMCMLLPKRIYT